MSDEFDEVRQYLNGIDPPDARTIAKVKSRFSSPTVASGARTPRMGRTKRINAVRWVGAVFVVLAVAVAILVPNLSHRAQTHARDAHLQDHLTRMVVDDVSVTVAAGSYDMTFNDTTTPATKPNCGQGGVQLQLVGPGQASTGPTSTTPTFEPCVTDNTLPPNVSTQNTLSSISGHGTVDLNPYAMVTESTVGALGAITLYDNGTNVWEIGGGDYGLSAPGQAGPGASLSGYASSVEGTVGQVQGALDMEGLASGTGYLDLEAHEIQGAQPAGTGDVEGVPVTTYKLSESGLLDPDIGGLTTEQVSTIRAADAIIEKSDFTGKTTWVSVDSDGYIREQKTQYTLPDGSTVTEDTILSNFGCAGTVLMPGQQGSSARPSGCVSPDHASGGSNVSPAPTNPPSTSSTTTTPPSTTTTTSPSAAIVPQRPTALAVGPNGNLYIADQIRNQILERRPDGSYVVVAGTGQVGYARDGGPAPKAELDRPDGMAFAANGTLYFADEGNQRVRAISPSGVITTVVGNGDPPTGGVVSDGTPARQAEVQPNDVAFSPDGHLYVSAGEQVLRLNADGTLGVVVGPGGSNATAGGVDGLAFDSAGNLYFFGFGSKTVFVVAFSGVLTEPYGQQSIYPRGDDGLATSPDGEVIAIDELSVVRLTATSEQTIISFTSGSSGPFNGIKGFSPNGIAIGPGGTIYVDTFYGNGFTDKSAIFSISPNGASSQILWEAPVGT